MKPCSFPGRKQLFSVFLTGVILCLLWFSAAAGAMDAGKEYQPAGGEFDSLGKAVVALLQTRDVARFATNLSASAEDWQSITTPNLAVKEQEMLKGFVESIPNGIQRLESSATALLTRADSLHLDFSTNPVPVQILAPSHVGKIYFSNPNEDRLTLPYLEKLEIVLNPRNSEGHSTNGDFKLMARGLEKFPGGWRITQGIQWTSFPTNVADEKTLQELAILEKVATYKGFTGQEDPALLILGEKLIRFIRESDAGMFEKELLMNSDLVWAMIQKSGRAGPSRQEVDEEIGKQVQEQVGIARQALKLMEDTGIDWKKANIQIKEVSVERSQSQGAPGSLDNLMGQQFKLVLAVKTDAKAKNGTLLSGEYVLAAKMITRLGEDWRIMEDLHWEKFPVGVVDSETAATIEFENYVAEHGTLPVGTAAPDIEFTTLVGQEKMKLSDLRGKVVVLDFWATWCGPCQVPMADLQKIRQDHPDWQDRVAIVPLSIDDTIDVVRQHVDKRGWTNTFNVWAGDGGWHAAPTTAFRVNGVPTTYVLDQQGKIVLAGHPFGLPISQTVDGLLKQ